MLWRITHIRICWAGGILFDLGTIAFRSGGDGGGALSIVAINYLYYRQMVKKGSARPVALQQKMFISTAIGLAVMAGSFIFMEWLNHAVVHGDRFLTRAEYSQAFIKGVPNITLLYVFATFFALALLWALPFPRHDSSSMQDGGRMGKAVRVAVFGGHDSLVRRCAVRCFEQGIRNSEWPARERSLES